MGTAVFEDLFWRWSDRPILHEWTALLELDQISVGSTVDLRRVCRSTLLTSMSEETVALFVKMLLHPKGVRTVICHFLWKMINLRWQPLRANGNPSYSLCNEQQNNGIYSWGTHKPKKEREQSCKKERCINHDGPFKRSTITSAAARSAKGECEEPVHSGLCSLQLLLHARYFPILHEQPKACMGS